MAAKPAHSLPNDLHQHLLASAPVELAIEDLLPSAEIQPAIRHRDHDVAAHHLALDVRVGVVFAGIVVTVLAHRLVRRQLLQPAVVILVQSRLIIVDKDGGRDVRGIYDAVTITTSGWRLRSSSYSAKANPGRDHSAEAGRVLDMGHGAAMPFTRLARSHQSWGREGRIAPR